MAGQLRDDATTLAALGILAFVFADFSHEALGHGLAILAAGAKPVMLTTAYFSSSGSVSRWIPASGGITNLVSALGCVVALRLQPAATPLTRFFLILAVAFNLLFAAAYPVYSAVAAFGDWAAVIAPLRPPWLWRALLALAGAILYYLSLLLLAAEIAPFNSDSERLRRITLIPYLAAIAVASFAAAFSPLGWRAMLSAGIPSAAAAFGLTQLDHFSQARAPRLGVPFPGPITRSVTWISAAVIAAILFVTVLGPGIAFSAG